MKSITLTLCLSLFSLGALASGYDCELFHGNYSNGMGDSDRASITQTVSENFEKVAEAGAYSLSAKFSESTGLSYEILKGKKQVVRVSGNTSKLVNMVIPGLTKALSLTCIKKE